MNYKNNQKYFDQKNYLLFIGIGVAVAGVILLIVGWWWMIGAVVTIIGVGMAAASRESLVKGEELDKEVARVEQTFADTVIEKHSLDKATADVAVFSDYVFDGESSATMKKGTDGKFRPKKAAASCLFVSGKLLFVENLTVSLVEDNGETKSEVYKLNDIEHITVSDHALEENGGVLVRYHTADIVTAEGEKFSLPTPQNSSIYDRFEQINKEIKSAKKAAKEAENQ
ncbi:MAG: hypothetical protein IJR55_03670 [Clostridia bacterium]|nr:hypothetical protein [Clostridia bacterium]